MSKAQETEIPLMKGTMNVGSADGKRVHGITDVRTVIIDMTDGQGVRKPLLGLIAGDQLVIIENNGAAAQQWLKEAVFAKLKSDGVEQG